MRLRRRILGLVLLAVLMGSTGCSLEEGAREGLSAGVSGALSALIQTPINHALDEAYADGGE